MKGLANSVGIATIVALGVQPGANGESVRQGTTVSAPVLGGDEAGFPVAAETLQELAFRRLMTAEHNVDGDDALDVNGGPLERAENILRARQAWAELEFEASKGTLHVNNGDRSGEASFHKTLPHNEFGEVDQAAFEALIACISASTLDACEAVPAGIDGGRLANPIAATAIDMAGPASSALTAPPAPTLDTADLAAQMAEVYWMSLVRDVPFSMYGENPDTIAAADNLATMSGFEDMPGVAVDENGRADPQTQLFRSTAVGVTTGPMISQLLVRDFTIDSIKVTPRQTTYKAGVDYMTSVEDWLFVQNGGKLGPEELDDVPRFVRNARDLSRLVATDTIYTEAFRGALVLLAEGAISGPGLNGPYAESDRQNGFVTFGVSHTMKILGSAEMSQRSSWYQKWNVHMFARPEAVAGSLHNHLEGNIRVHFHKSLRKNTELLERVRDRNEEMNGMTNGLGRTLMLSQAVASGSPDHPSYPAGHAVQNGAFATVLKAMVGISRATECFDSPVFPDDDGLELLPWTGTDCLTYEGEINKMAVNVAFGRQMCGVHYRMDSEEGLRLGEIVGVRMLQQEIEGFPEQAGYEFNLFSGETIRLEPGGSFFVDGHECHGVLFEGAALC